MPLLQEEKYHAHMLGDRKIKTNEELNDLITGAVGSIHVHLLQHKKMLTSETECIVKCLDAIASVITEINLTNR
jgi:pyruvate formate-lyase activating enzyme-like uncharacterized protein